MRLRECRHLAPSPIHFCINRARQRRYINVTLCPRHDRVAGLERPQVPRFVHRPGENVLSEWKDHLGQVAMRCENLRRYLELSRSPGGRPADRRHVLAHNGVGACVIVRLEGRTIRPSPDAKWTSRWSACGDNDGESRPQEAVDVPRPQVHASDSDPEQSAEHDRRRHANGESCRCRRHLPRLQHSAAEPNHDERCDRRGDQAGEWHFGLGPSCIRPDRTPAGPTGTTP
jgi:hypothetical protein